MRLPYVTASGPISFESITNVISVPATLRLSGIILALLLSGCGDEQPRQQSSEKKSGLTKVEQTDWLSMQDETAPGDWLIAREMKSGAKLLPDDADKLRQSLAEASARFKDSPRMIANRAVQLEQMLKDEGSDETASVLIGGLTKAVAPGRIESFGAAGQQYYNMRKAGLSRERAFDELSKHYGTGG
ncbi:hypothetical protein [Hyphomicrobium sp.]|uniref:hypothetical protein n=1 Tax=Hyphomicrobium sp. TaxID=82 RepID=UPI000FA96CFE|nr:hypothetical protein [Hyphomicrobium sp.]RUP11218.1 MAG: hypothetical protein EKK38_01845 [Hyphomicrobium sp.]